MNEFLMILGILTILGIAWLRHSFYRKPDILTCSSQALMRYRLICAKVKKY